MDISSDNIFGEGSTMSSEDVHESDAGNEETDENNFESNLRRRKGKIISCAKETIESGPSTGMEAAAIVEGFKLSEALYGIRYNRVIGDGDSSVYKKILDARPYEKTHIEKIECRNHLMRNLRKKLRELFGNTAYTLAARKHLGKNLARIVIGIHMAIKNRKNSTLPLKDKIQLLSKDIGNTPNHVFGNHDGCERYFCDGPKDTETDCLALLKENGFLEKIKAIIYRIQMNSKSLIYDVDSNTVERYHSIVAKTVGGKRVNFSRGQSYTARAKFAVLQHNTKRAHFFLQKTAIQKSPSSRIVKMEQQRLRRGASQQANSKASRHLRRKVPYAGHLMTPRRLWLNKIPTQCDVVIEFPEDAPDEALRWLLARIRSQPPSGLGLIAQVKSHESTKRTAFYISAPINILYKAAEEARLPKRLRSDLGGALREFTTREVHCFAQTKTDDGSTTLFTSQERQWLVLQVLQGLRAGPTDLESLQGKAAVEEGQSIVAAWQDSGLIIQVFPLHETSALTLLQMSWVRKVFAPQPLDDIAEYFGVKVALYFAWLGHYTCALGVPAFLGTILWAALLGRGQTAQDMGHVLFSLFNVAWASLYLEAWRRYSVELAFRWGTLSTPPELLEPPRPLYKGPLEESTVTGRLEPREAPVWQRRAFRYLVSFPVIGLCLALVFVVMFLMLQFQDWWDSKLPEGGVLSCLSVIPKVLLAGAITLMDEAYYKLAVWLNDRENYRLQSKYENHLIAKVALFQFVNSFLSLFYIAFYLRDQEKLKEQLAGLLISRQIIGNLRESAIPYAYEQWRLAKLSFKMWGALSPTSDAAKSVLDTQSNNSTESVDKPAEAASRRNIGQAEIESSLYKYDGTFSDHLEMLVQMGYVVLFSAAFPLAGLCALANNLLEIRSDAFKLAHVHQRPFGQRVANIGTWQNALSLLGLAAVIVNCALIGLSGQVSRLWPGLTTTQTIVLIVALEHVMLGLRSALTWLLPELPSWLAAEIARAEHCRREMQCKGPSPRPTPPSPPSTTSVSAQEQVSPDIITTNDQSLESQLAEDIMYEPGSPGSPLLLHQFDDINSALQSSIEADVNIAHRRDSSPDSPPSQTSTVLIRPLHEITPPNSGVSMQNLPLEIPPYSGPSSTMALSQPIQIPEIPPFRKKSNEDQKYLSESPQKKNSTPSPKVQDIPSFRSRKSTELSPQNSGESQLNPTHGPEWMKRLKVTEAPTIHRSIDCIASKELATNSNSEPDILKPAPSWTNISTTKAEPSSSTGSSGNVQKSPTTDDEAKAAEIAAKKSRIKQSLVKRARSVAIFSLKLKERRQREAEKAAQAAVQHAKTLNIQPPGGELSLIPIEKLIQVDDVIKSKSSGGSGTM